MLATHNITIPVIPQEFVRPSPIRRVLGVLFDEATQFHVELFVGVIRNSSSVSLLDSFHMYGGGIGTLANIESCAE
jgi:hypothetical protein